jgi:hypothetical protein
MRPVARLDLPDVRRAFFMGLPTDKLQLREQLGSLAPIAGMTAHPQVVFGVSASSYQRHDVIKSDRPIGELNAAQVTPGPVSGNDRRSVDGDRHHGTQALMSSPALCCGSVRVPAPPLARLGIPGVAILLMMLAVVGKQAIAIPSGPSTPFGFHKLRIALSPRPGRLAVPLRVLPVQAPGLQVAANPALAPHLSATVTKLLDRFGLPARWAGLRLDTSDRVGLYPVKWSHLAAFLRGVLLALNGTPAIQAPGHRSALRRERLIRQNSVASGACLHGMNYASKSPEWRPKWD